MSDHHPSTPEQPEARERPADDRRWPRSDRETIESLSTAAITDCQLVPWGSNYTFAVSLERPGSPSRIGIYKPREGEIPLWDFEAGTLYRREYAAYLLSRMLGWRFIPPTVIRDGPHGIGTVQLYIEPDDRVQDRSLRREHITALQRVALFDLVANNADRKASHCFVGRDDGLVWGIDHGLTFHTHPKLRTVIWDFCGERISPALLARLAAIERHERRVRALLGPYLRSDEIDALFARIRIIRASGVYPRLDPRRNVPYGW